MTEITRRRLLQVATATAVSKELGHEASASENKPQKAGANIRGELYTRGPIEIYTNRLSAVAGDEVTLHVSTMARKFDVQIARIGLEETVVWTRQNLRGVFHATPDDAWEKGCGWPASVRLKIPTDWKSGYYQIKAITADDGASREEFLAFVVVRAAQPTAKILVVLSTNTYAAYNTYGGANFYQKKGTGQMTGVSGTTGEHKMSFHRPWMPGFLWKPEDYRFDAPYIPEDWDDRGINKKLSLSAWSPCAGFHSWERVMVRWLEQHGYAVDYAINSDLEFHPELLGRYRLMLSVGHDEYWSWGMRDAVESFVARGGNVCFFSGNIAVWQVRHEDQGASLVCYKDAYQDDPVFKTDQKHLTATYTSSHIIGRPETRMTGLSLWYGGMARFGGATPQGPGGYLIYRPEHWVFKDSGMTYGDCFGQASTIIHYEIDGCPIRLEYGLPYPTSDHDAPSSLEILGLVPVTFDQGVRKQLSALAKAVYGDGNPKAVKQVSGNYNHGAMSIYTTKGTVFCGGTTDWTSGLTGKDPAVERVTKNLLDRLST